MGGAQGLPRGKARARSNLDDETAVECMETGTCLNKVPPTGTHEERLFPVERLDVDLLSPTINKFGRCESALVTWGAYALCVRVACGRRFHSTSLRSRT